MSAFLEGFAAVTGFSPREAEEQWAAFSRQLPDAEIVRIEQGGRRAGEREGRKFRAMFPEESEL
jgi:hypothetical protein